jgi:hypothetical protein
MHSVLCCFGNNNTCQIINALLPAENKGNAQMRYCLSMTVPAAGTDHSSIAAN